MRITLNDLEDRAFLARNLPGISRMELDYIAMQKRRFRTTLNVVSRIEYKSILDIGCGKGIFLLLLGASGIGIGREDEVEICRDRGVRAFAHDLESGNLLFQDQSFDLILCLEVIEHIGNHNELIHEIYRVLKRGGKLLISTPNSRFASWKLRDFILTMPYGSKLYYRNLESEVEKDVYRYSAEGLREFLMRNGFHIELVGYTRIFLPNDDILLLAVK